MAALRADWRARLPSDPTVLVPAPPAGIVAAHSTLGAAIDHRLGLALSDQAQLRGSVRPGVARVVEASPDRPELGRALQDAGQELISEASALVLGLRPFDPAAVLSAADEERLARVCVVAVWFEESTAPAGSSPARRWPGRRVRHPRRPAGGRARVRRRRRRGRPRSREFDGGRGACAGCGHRGSAVRRRPPGRREVDRAPGEAAGADIQQLACYLLLDTTTATTSSGSAGTRADRRADHDAGPFLRLLAVAHPLDQLRRDLAAALVEAAPSRPRRVWASARSDRCRDVHGLQEHLVGAECGLVVVARAGVVGGDAASSSSAPASRAVTVVAPKPVRAE